LDHALRLEVWASDGGDAHVGSRPDLEALQAHRLRGAVLDVFSEEPLPASSPFWTTPNTFITGHTSAPSFPRDIVGVFVDNFRRFHAGLPLQHRVDFARGY